MDVVPTFMGAHAVPKEYKGKTDEFIKLIKEEMIPGLQKSLAEFCDVFYEDRVFDKAVKRNTGAW